MPAKTASWRQRSEPPYRRPTMSPQMSQMSLTPLDQRTNQMRSLFLTARDPSLWTAQTAKHQHRTKRKVQAANRHSPPRPPQPSSAYIQTVPLLPTESLRTKKTITVTRKRRAKKTTWSPRLLVLIIHSRMQTLGGTTAPHKPKVLEPPLSAPQPVMWTVLMTMVRLIRTC